MKQCPTCGTPLVRRPKCYFYRGAIMHGWVCEPCNSLWDTKGAFMKYVKKRLKK